jgi:hypothetical protein
MSVASENAFIPHEVIIDEFAGDRKEGTFTTLNFIRVQVTCISFWA